MKRMPLVCAMSCIALLCIAGCSPAAPSQPPADPGPDPLALADRAEKSLDTLYSTLRFEETRPPADAPLTVAPCELMPAGSAVNGVDVSEDQRRKGKSIGLKSPYVLQAKDFRSEMAFSLYPQPAGTDMSGVLAELLVAAQECGPRKVSMLVKNPDNPVGMESRTADVTTTAAIDGDFVVVLSDTPKPAPSEPGSDWTVGPDGKLVPPPDFRAPTSTGVPYGQAMLFATAEQVLIQVTLPAMPDAIRTQTDVYPQLSSSAKDEVNKALIALHRGLG